MKILISIVLIFNVCLAAFVIFPKVSAQPQNIQWEYKFEYNLKEGKANELGAEGWELAAASPTGSITAFVFKRQKK